MLSMPALCKSAPSKSPAGPAPMMATWVRMGFALNAEVLLQQLGLGIQLW
jgi:hypothetical protein